MTSEPSVPGELLRALRFASYKHRKQRRKDADASPYINHPIAVAELLATTGEVSDIATLSAAVLHDTIEDTETTSEELEAAFGAEVRHRGGPHPLDRFSSQLRWNPGFMIQAA